MHTAHHQHGHTGPGHPKLRRVPNSVFWGSGAARRRGCGAARAPGVAEPRSRAGCWLLSLGKTNTRDSCISLTPSPEPEGSPQPRWGVGEALVPNTPKPHKWGPHRGTGSEPTAGYSRPGWLKGLGSRGRGSRRAVPCLPSPRCSGARPPPANNTDRGAVAGARRGRRCTSPAANGSARSRRLPLPAPPGSVRGTDNASGGREILASPGEAPPPHRGRAQVGKV